MNSYARALTLSQNLNTAVADQDPLPFTATVNPKQAAGIVLARPAILLTPPRLTFDRRPPDATATWTLLVLVGDADASVSWERADLALSALHGALSGLSEAIPSDWQLPDGGAPTFAYSVTYEEVI